MPRTVPKTQLPKRYQDRLAAKYADQQFREYVARSFRAPDVPRILVEGDSWFSFPLHYNVVDHLEQSVGAHFLRLEASGDEILEMLSGRQKEFLTFTIRELAELDLPISKVLISGGGNDLVGANFRQWIRDQPDPAEDGCLKWVYQDRFRRKIGQVEAAYHELCDLVGDLAPNARIVGHGYDYPIPSKRPVKWFGSFGTGPWMWPSFEREDYPDPKPPVVPEADRGPVVRWMIDQFNLALSNVEASRPMFTFARTPGTLAAHEWSDEIHPTQTGFARIAAAIATLL